MKRCRKCDREKDVSEFHNDKARKDGKYPNCKECHYSYMRAQSNTPEAKEKRRVAYADRRKNDEEFQKRNLERSAQWYNSNFGRARTLYHSAKRRSGKWGSFDITVDFILEKIENGCCEITGIPFDVEKSERSVKNPFSPSIDRIDSAKGYTKDNVRIVIWQVNLMRGELNDCEIVEICKKFIEGIESGLDL